MRNFICKYYVTPGNRVPVEEFVDSLNERGQKKFYYFIELLEARGHLLSLPHAKYVGDSIFELRFFAEEGAIRILYFFFDAQDVILTNGFVKKSNQTPQQEKNLAIERRKEYLERKTKENL